MLSGNRKINVRYNNNNKRKIQDWSHANKWIAKVYVITLNKCIVACLAYSISKKYEVRLIIQQSMLFAVVHHFLEHFN